MERNFPDQENQIIMRREADPIGTYRILKEFLR